MGIGIGPWDIFLNPTVDRANDFSWTEPEENGPPTDGKVSPYS